MRYLVILATCSAWKTTYLGTNNIILYGKIRFWCKRTFSTWKHLCLCLVFFIFSACETVLTTYWDLHYKHIIISTSQMYSLFLLEQHVSFPSQVVCFGSSCCSGPGLGTPSYFPPASVGHISLREMSRTRTLGKDMKAWVTRSYPSNSNVAF